MDARGPAGPDRCIADSGFIPALSIATESRIQTFTGDFGRGEARWHTLQSDGPQLLFSPANGLPFRTYEAFLTTLATGFSISGVDNRGAWPNATSPPRSHNWEDHADDLIAFVEHHCQAPLTAVGHSIGATVIALAAVRRADLFDSLILIDPATTPNRLLSTLLSKLPRRLANRFPLIGKTRARREFWDTQQQFLDYLSERRAYAKFTEAALGDYARGGLEPTADGRLRLIFRPQWEAHNFHKVVYVWGALQKIRVPTLILRAQYSHLLRQHVFRRALRRCSPSVAHETIDGTGHLAPQEAPERVAHMVMKRLGKR